MTPSTIYYKPHVIKKVGSKHQNQSLEYLMFSDYKFLSYLLERIEHNLTPQTRQGYFYLRLKWLIGQGENRIAKKLCPQCGKSPITHFSVRGNKTDGYSMSTQFACCDEIECQKELKSLSNEPVLIQKATFSNSSYFDYQSDKDRWMAMIKEIHNLIGPITGELALNFFKEPGKPP